MLYIYIAPGQGQTTSWGQNFDVNRNSLSLCPFVASFKTNLLKSDFFTFFFFLCVFFFHMYIAPGRGRQCIGDKNFMTTERPFFFAHILQVSKWSLKSDLIHSCNVFIHVYSPRARAENPLETNFWCQIKSPYHFDHSLQLSNKSLWILILYTIF